MLELEYPFYFTWVKQSNPLRLSVKSVDGVKIYTEQGNELIDLSSISYQASFGHNHPTIIKSIKKQLDAIPMSAPKAIFPLKTKVTNNLLKYMGRKDGKIFYTTGGAETVENALKIARDITKKKIILARKISYHGATQGALCATGDWRNQAHTLPENWVLRIPEPNEENAIEKTRQIILEAGPENIAAFILETITGGNGVWEGSKKWWEGIKKLCKEFGILLILDEVVCGFGRTGLPFGYMHYNLKPDMICMSKGITGGMIPFGALWTKDYIHHYYMDNVFACGLTNYAHPIGLAALRGVLEICQSVKFQTHLEKICHVFKRELEILKSHPGVKTIRYKGMLAAVELDVAVEFKIFQDQGLYLASQNKQIILAPPLIIKEKELVEAMKRFKKAVDYCAIKQELIPPKPKKKIHQPSASKKVLPHRSAKKRIA